MSPNITDKLHLTFDYVDPSQMRVTLSTYGEIERTRFERTCKTTHINPDNFGVYVEERQRGKSSGETDRYFFIKSDRCLRDVVFEGERFYFTHTHKRLRSFPDIRRLYRSTEQIVDECSTEQIVDECMDYLLQEFDAPKASKAPKAVKSLKAPKAPKIPKALKTLEVGELGEEIKNKISKCQHPNWTFSVCDKGGHHRTLCCHPFNENKKAYRVLGVTQRPDCMCPLHRQDTFWRRLTSHALHDRNTKIKGDSFYVKTIVGLTSVQEYHRKLENDFRETFETLIDSSYIKKNYLELERDKFVIDELYPRCEGKFSKESYNIAYFLATVFNYKNTQLIIHNNNHARELGVDTERYKMLINGSKGGTVEESAKEKFSKIIPSDGAISYMLNLVNTFIEKEPKLEIRL
jgi:hypothetical protein